MAEFGKLFLEAFSVCVGVIILLALCLGPLILTLVTGRPSILFAYVLTVPTLYALYKLGDPQRRQE